MVRRHPADGHGLGGRQGRQPRRADGGRPPRPPGIRHHGRGLPRRHRPGRHPGAPGGHPRRSPHRVTGRPRPPGRRGPRPRARRCRSPRTWPAGIVKAYERLGEDVRVAVRSSGIGEDAEGTSFAGMNETFTNVAGEERASWPASWTAGPRCGSARSIFYRGDKDLTAEPAIAVVVQEMIPSERSGVMFTHRSLDRRDGSHRDRGRLRPGRGRRERSWSSPTPTWCRQGRAPPPARPGGHAAFKIVRGPDGEDQRIELDAAEGGRRVLTDEEVVEVARLGSGRRGALRLAAGHGVGHGRRPTYLVQSRPVTAVGGDAAPAATAESGHAARAGPGGLGGPGLRASCGCCRSPDQGDRLQAGEVLVAPMTSPDWVPTMRRAAAIVTDGGGMTCHAAIVSRELGVPAVVGARNATTVLRDGELVTVDGAQGTVTEGAVAPPRSPSGRRGTGAGRAGRPGALATKIYVNLAFADHAEEVAALPVDGVGLLRAEFMVTDALEGVHPRKLLERGDEKTFVDEHGQVAAAHHAGLRAAAGRVPEHRLPLQRVLQPRGRRPVRAARGEPDDRVPGLLPLRPRARPLPARARRPGPGAARRRRTSC